MVPLPPHLRPGAVLAGRYRIVRPLGVGATGHVLEVRHIELDRAFAMKFLQLARYTDDAVARLRLEALALGRIESDRVVRIVDFGLDPDVGPYLVEERVRGEPLDRAIAATGGLPLDEALAIASAVASALADVHEAGLVHRDVKPSNVVRCGEPAVAKLIDFGLVLGESLDRTTLTQSAVLIGSLPYLAPEVYAGERASAASDQWSLGVLLFECLTARLPFDGASAAALAAAIPRDPRPSVPTLPAAVDVVLDRLLAKDPAARFGSCREAQAAIESCRASASDTFVPAPRPVKTPVNAPIAKSRRGWAAAALALLVIAIGSAGMVALGDRSDPPTSPAATIVRAAPIESVAPEVAPREKLPPPAVQPIQALPPECSRYVREACTCSDRRLRARLCREAREIEDPAVCRRNTAALLDRCRERAEEPTGAWTRDVITEY